MASVITARPTAAVLRTDRWAVPAAMLALVALQVAATGSISLFHRLPWLDEYHTLLIVGDPSLPHAMDALKHGADVNAPGLYLLGRAVSWGVGSSDPATIRGIGFASVLAGIAGIYATARRAYPPGVAMIAAMAAWAHPLATRHAFEARFYGPWFAGIVWFAYALNLWDRSARKAGPGLLIALTSAFVCTIHYFGVISLGLVVAAHTAFARGSWKDSLTRLIPVGAGPMALAACLPFYFGQKRSLSVPTWVDPPSLVSVRLFLEGYFGFYLLAIPVLGFFASRFRARPEPEEVEPEEEARRFPELAGMAGLVLMPAALVAFSVLVQSALVDRYTIPGVAAIGLLIAPIVARIGTPLRGAVLVGLLGFSTINLSAAVRHHAIVDSRRHEAVAILARLGDGPVLFRMRKDLYEFWWDAPNLRSRLFLWDPTDLVRDVPDRLVIERDMARNHDRWYGVGKIAGLASFGDRPVVYLYGLDPPDIPDLERSEPGIRLRTIDARRGLYEATRPTGPARSGG